MEEDRHCSALIINHQSIIEHDIDTSDISKLEAHTDENVQQHNRHQSWHNIGMLKWNTGDRLLFIEHQHVNWTSLRVHLNMHLLSVVGKNPSNQL